MKYRPYRDPDAEPEKHPIRDVLIVAGVVLLLAFAFSCGSGRWPCG
jgi:hypothetical protein